ncbi:MAG: hypothetical protein ACKODX_08520 [Gemmata sp.]
MPDSVAKTCTPGRLAVLATVLAVAVGLIMTGGGMFSPGQLSAQQKGAPLGGARSHADIGNNCSACHASPWSRETMADRCMACHTDVRGQIAARGPLHGRFANATVCRACHTEHKGGTATLTDLAHFDHNCAAFQLTGRHASVECQRCHTGSHYKGTATTCAGCHAEPKVHLGQFGTDCQKCHGTDTWRTAAALGGSGPGGAFDHSKTAFPLTGHHSQTDCKKCHVSNTFKGTPTSCVACHPEPKTHLGKFGTDCQKCHTTSDWRLVGFNTGGGNAVFDHSKTAFPLTGKHATGDCRKCHADNKFKGTPTACVACHPEPKVHAQSKFGTDCQKCHTTATWANATLGDYKHTFPVAHGAKRSKNACATCHKGSDGYVTYTCYGCHEHNPDKVARQHKKINDPLVLANCVKCHKNGRGNGRERAGFVAPAGDLMASCPADDGLPPSASCPHAEPLEGLLFTHFALPVPNRTARTASPAPVLTGTSPLVLERMSHPLATNRRHTSGLFEARSTGPARTFVSLRIMGFMGD